MYVCSRVTVYFTQLVVYFKASNNSSLFTFLCIITIKWEANTKNQTYVDGAHQDVDAEELFDFCWGSIEQSALSLKVFAVCHVANINRK